MIGVEMGLVTSNSRECSEQPYMGGVGLAHCRSCTLTTLPVSTSVAMIMCLQFDHVHLVSGTEAGIRLYSDEIVSITCSALTSQSWTTKAQAAVTISAIALKLGKIVNLKELFS